jgi:hypothetical protein
VRRAPRSRRRMPHADRRQTAARARRRHPRFAGADDRP